MSDGSAMCWPEQYPGERQAYERAWAEADKKYPNRKRSCGYKCEESMYPCRHCFVCGKFVKNITMYGGEIGGMMAVNGECKTHGEQSLDTRNWLPEFFEGDES